MSGKIIIEVGADEAGRGPWAGPIVAAVCQLTQSQVLFFTSLKITDSKALSAKKRQSFFNVITNECIWSVGVVSAKDIDILGLQKANVLAYELAVKNCNFSSEQKILCDYVGAFKNYWSLKNPVDLFPKGESKYISIACASIIAKVWRDKYMSCLDKVYPGYDFVEHAGYGTKKHQLALEKLGITPCHRKSFAPIKKFVSG